MYMCMHMSCACTCDMHMCTQTLCEVKRPQETIQSRAVKYDAARKMPPASQQPARSGEAGAGRCV